MGRAERQALGPAGRPEEALPMLEKAARLSPQDPLMHEFLFSMASAHFAAGRYEEAIRFARRSLDLQPGQPGAWRVIAAASGYRGRIVEARAACEKMMELAPETVSRKAGGRAAPSAAPPSGVLSDDAVFTIDLDGDGAMDVVSCCEGRTRTIYVHWAPSLAAEYRKESLWKTEPIPVTAGKKMWMFALPLQVDGRHGIDLVVGAKGGEAEIGRCLAK